MIWDALYIAKWNIVVQIVPFPELFYTLLWNPFKHQTTPLIIEVPLWLLEVWVRGLYNSWWFCVHKLSMFIYLSMLGIKKNDSKKYRPKFKRRLCTHLSNYTSWKRFIRLKWILKICLQYCILGLTTIHCRSLPLMSNQVKLGA